MRSVLGEGIVQPAGCSNVRAIDDDDDVVLLFVVVLSLLLLLSLF